MLAHGLTVGSSELGSQGTNGVIQLLDLRLSQHSSSRLVLQTVDQSGKQTDVLLFNWTEFILISDRRVLCVGRRGVAGCLLL